MNRDRDKIFEEYLEKGANVSKTAEESRGLIIEVASDIENELTNIITWCFYPAQYSIKLLPDELLDKNGIIFKSVILRKLSFSDKIDMLKEVIIARKPDIWQSYNHLIKEISNKLHKAREFRNLMAHAPSDLSVKYIKSLNKHTYQSKNFFKVIEYKKGELKEHTYNKEKIDNEMLKLLKIQLQLMQLFAVINEDIETYTSSQELVNVLSSS